MCCQLLLLVGSEKWCGGWEVLAQENRGRDRGGGCGMNLLWLPLCSLLFLLASYSL